MTNDMNELIAGFDRRVSRSKLLNAAHARLRAAKAFWLLVYVVCVPVPWSVSMLWRWDAVSGGEVVAAIIVTLVGCVAATVIADRVVGKRLIAAVKREFPELEL